MPLFPFPTQPAYTAISIAYRNKRLIADEALPRVTVGKTDFRYLKHDLAEGFTIPDTKVGRKSQPGQVSFTATEEAGITKDYALDDPIPMTDVLNAPTNNDPRDKSVLMLTDLIALDREVRTANLIFAAATYPAGKKVQLAGQDQWSDAANSDPIADITTGIETLIFRPNVMVLGRQVFTTLAQHPKVVKAVHGNAGDVGYVKSAELADLFELDKVLVGEAFVNTAKKGQAASLNRVWGKHASLHWLDPVVATAMGRATFGFTAEFGSRVAGAIEDEDIGMRGGWRVRVGESVAEVIAASDLGYFIQDAIA